VIVPGTSKTYLNRVRLHELGGEWQKDEKHWILPAASLDEVTALLEPRAREGRVAGAKRMRDVLGRVFETVASVMQARKNVLVSNATAAVAADPRYRFLDRDSRLAQFYANSAVALGSGYPVFASERRPQACEDCGCAIAHGHRRSPYSPPEINYCDRRFRMAPGGPALSTQETRKERRRAQADYESALDNDAGMSSFGLLNTGFVYRRALEKKTERRRRDRDQGIGHCGVVVCVQCSESPHHTCRNESAISSEVADDVAIPAAGARSASASAASADDADLSEYADSDFDV
jgi:hypothetical protein